MSETNSQRALHYSAGKSGVDQIPVEVLLEWGQVFTYGEKKYERDNWKKGNDWHEFYGSALRHLLAFWSGEDFDNESGLPHLAHALWNVGALRDFQIAGIGVDDRPVIDSWYPDYGLPLADDDDPSDPGPSDDSICPDCTEGQHCYGNPCRNFCWCLVCLT